MPSSVRMIMGACVHHTAVTLTVSTPFLHPSHHTLSSTYRYSSWSELTFRSRLCRRNMGLWLHYWTMLWVCQLACRSRCETSPVITASRWWVPYSCSLFGFYLCSWFSGAVTDGHYEVLLAERARFILAWCMTRRSIAAKWGTDDPRCDG